MASNSLFVSVMTPPVTGGVLSVYVETDVFSSSDTGVPLNTVTGLPETFSLPSLISFTLNISGISGLMTEIDLADQIFYQMGTYLIQKQLNYLGFIAYAEETYPGTFQTSKTEHSVCMWSQSIFRMKITSNTVGAKIVINKSPVLLTYADALDQGAQIGFDFLNPDGSAMTTDQVINMVLTASSFLTNRTKK